MLGAKPLPVSFITYRNWPQWIVRSIQETVLFENDNIFVLLMHLKLKSATMPQWDKCSYIDYDKHPFRVLPLWLNRTFPGQNISFFFDYVDK